MCTAGMPPTQSRGDGLSSPVGFGFCHFELDEPGKHHADSTRSNVGGERTLEGLLLTASPVVQVLCSSDPHVSHTAVHSIMIKRGGLWWGGGGQLYFFLF